MSDLIFEYKETVAILTLNRAEAHNALSKALAQEASEALRTAEANSQVRSILIMGAGGKAFSAGTDLKERRFFDTAQKIEQAKAGADLNRAVLECSKPVLAAIGGWCLGGGLELALHCDARIAAEDSVFGFPEMSLGSFPGAGGPLALQRLLGSATARELLLFPARFGAAEALRLGLISKSVSKDALRFEGIAFARRAGAAGPLALSALKEILLLGEEGKADDAQELARKLHGQLAATEDAAEGLAAHFEKRAPNFKGK